MNNIKKVALALILLVVCTATNAQQKIGHIRSNEVIQKMDEYKIAEMVLDSFTKALKAEITTYQQELQKKQEAYQALPATTPDATRRMKEKEITDMDQRIQEFAQSAQTEIQNKQTALLEPIQKKLQNAIEQVAKEKAYTYVLDDQALLVKPDADDMTAAVMTKLGIKTPATAPVPLPVPGNGPKK